MKTKKTTTLTKTQQGNRSQQMAQRVHRGTFIHLQISHYGSRRIFSLKFKSKTSIKNSFKWCTMRSMKKLMIRRRKLNMNIHHSECLTLSKERNQSILGATLETHRSLLHSSAKRGTSAAIQIILAILIEAAARYQYQRDSNSALVTIQ